MAANYVQEGCTLTLAAPYNVSAGAGALFSANLFGVALGTIASGDEGEFAIEGVWDLLAATADTFAVCANVYWDDSAKKCDSSSTGNTLIGVATKAKTGSQTTVRVRLNGVSF